ncbi:MAG: hypothetical protein ACR2GN_03465 [Bacteroidia bacterium]
MDFQLILYIIIVIVWLVLDNYRRIKKKQDAAGKPNTTTAYPTETEAKPYSTLEDILREFGMDEGQPEVITERKPRPVKKVEKAKPTPVKYETYESNINKDYKFSGGNFKRDFVSVPNISNEITKTEIGDETEISKKSADLDFDLRKAVIWSEILKRPYT